MSHKKAFLIELEQKPFEQELLKAKNIELVTSIFDADIIILHGGIYCCAEDEGYNLVRMLRISQKEKNIYIIHGHHLHDILERSEKIFGNRFMKFEFDSL